MKYKLSPSILAADFNRLGEQIKCVEQNGADCLHIDVMDGCFVPSISFGMPLVSSIRRQSHLFFDVHLMIEDPERYIEDFVRCGADGITVHLEALKDAALTLSHIKRLGKRCALAVSPETDVAGVLPLADMLDMVLIMTVRPGFGGQSYIEASTEKIIRARELLKEVCPDIDIQVDGGITRDNIGTVLDAGANVIVMGSSVFEGDIAGNMAYFRRVFNERG